MYNCSQPKRFNFKGTIMKIKARAIAGMFVFSSILPLFTSAAAGPYDLAIPRLFRHASDHQFNTATIIEKPKMIISSLKVPALEAESGVEKRPAPSAEPQATLCGLKGVLVFIEDIDPDVEKHGLTKTVLQKEIEARLRQANIPVLTREEADNTPGKPYLYLNLTTHNTGIDLYSYSIMDRVQSGCFSHPRAIHQNKRDNMDC